MARPQRATYAPAMTRRHKTFTHPRLYTRHRDALPYVRAAAKASLFARLHPCGHPEYPSSRGSARLLQATTRRLEEESDTKCRNQRVP